MSFHLYNLGTRIDGAKELFEIPQLKLLLLGGLSFVYGSQISIYLFVTHFFGPVHELIHEKGYNTSLEVVLFLDCVRNFCLLWLGFDSKLSVNDIEELFINLHDDFSIAFFEYLVGVIVLHYFY